MAKSFEHFVHQRFGFFIATSVADVRDIMITESKVTHSRHRSIHNFLMNMFAAMGAYCFFTTKPEENFDFEVPQSNGQLVLWQ